MIARDEIEDVLKGYEEPCIGLIGSHSALEMAYGARQEGVRTVVVCQRGREEVYARYYRNLFDEIMVLERFSDMLDEDVQERLRRLSTIFVPSRSFSVYVGYDGIEEEFLIPLMGNRRMLRMEERSAVPNQYDLLRKAGLRLPKVFSSMEDVDRLVLVKLMEKDGVERAFYLASTPAEAEAKGRRLVELNLVDEAALESAVIEEYILGAKFNANFFWSPLTRELELLGFDRRIQTNLDGFLDLPAREQLELDVTLRNIEIGHYGATMRESQIAKIYEAGESFVEAAEREVPPGMIGLFALQGAVDSRLDFYVYDLSPRIPGCPCVEPTSPYMKYRYGFEVGPGRRVAMEIKKAAKKGLLAEIVT